MTVALVGARVFDGESIRGVHTVVLEGDRIAAVVPGTRAPRRVRQVDCAGGLLVPGFLDVQVNGGGGVLFNDAPGVATLETMVAAHRRFGTTGMLPTLISDAWETMEAAAEAVAAARRARVPGIVGIHFEGPYLNPARRGVHPEARLRGVDPGFVDLVSRPDLGRVLVTLAPECVPSGTVAALVEAGARVSLGHTAATREQVVAALDEGASGFTHLWNGMPPLRGRAPGPVGAALTDPRGWRGVIVDGHHVDPVALQLGLALRGPEAFVLVTDAMGTVGTDCASFELAGGTVRREGGKLTTADGRLAGSDLDMATAVRNAVRLMGVTPDQALAMASRHPAQWLGLDHEHGRLAPGYPADLVLLDADLAPQQTWLAGLSPDQES